MGFVRIFWKNNVQEAYLPKMSIWGQIVSEIVAQLCLQNSIQTLLKFFWVDPNNIFYKRFSYVLQACTVFLVQVFSSCGCQPSTILRHPSSPHLWSKTRHGQRLQHCKDIIQHAETKKIQGNVKKCLNTISAHMHIKVINNFQIFCIIYHF